MMPGVQTTILALNFFRCSTHSNWILLRRVVVSWHRSVSSNQTQFYRLFNRLIIRLWAASWLDRIANLSNIFLGLHHTAARIKSLHWCCSASLRFASHHLSITFHPLIHRQPSESRFLASDNSSEWPIRDEWGEIVRICRSLALRCRTLASVGQPSQVNLNRHRSSHGCCQKTNLDQFRQFERPHVVIAAVWLSSASSSQHKATSGMWIHDKRKEDWTQRKVWMMKEFAFVWQ